MKLLVLAAIVTAGSALYAQDSGAQLLQQQQMQMVQQQQMQTQQQMAQNAQQQAQQNAENSNQLMLDDQAQRRYLAEHAPHIAPDGGHFRQSVQVALTLPGAAPADAVMLYTLDGSKPDANAARYTAPLTLTKDARLRAVTWSSKDGAGPESGANFKVR